MRMMDRLYDRIITRINTDKYESDLTKDLGDSKINQEILKVIDSNNKLNPKCGSR